MTSNVLREFLRREPFESFRIRLNDGGSLEVKHPESVVLPPGWDSMSIVTFPNGKFEFVYLKNVTTIESEGRMPITPKGRRKRNGGEF